MQNEIFTRLVWTGMIVLSGVGIYRTANYFILQHNRGKILTISRLRANVPGIVYFTAPGCVPCTTIQKPALNDLRRHLADTIEIIEIDAIQKPELADHWGVLSVPTTFIIDSKGRPREINRGAVRFAKLLQQIEEVETSRRLPNEVRIPMN